MYEAFLTLARLGGHQAIELGVARELVGEGHQGATHFDQAVARVHVGNIAELQVGNVQELGQLHAIGAGLVEHDNEFAVGQHAPGRMALQKIVHVLGDPGAERAVLTHSLPEGKQEVGAVFMLKEQVDFINNNEGVFSFGSVLGDAVQDAVQYHQHPDGKKLLA